MKIGIIGFGASSIGFVERIKEIAPEIHIFEKSKDIFSSSISGIRADGKLFVSRDMGGDLDLDLELQKKLVDFYISKTEEKKYETGSSFQKKEYYNKFYEKGFQPVVSDFYHIGTDQLKEVLLNIYKEYSSNPAIHFHFNHPVQEIAIKANKVIIDQEFAFDQVIVSVGRSGHNLVKKIITRFPEVITDNTKVDLGIRYELPDHIVADLNQEMYEFKVRYKSRTGYMVRTFCNNPSGYVVTEHYEDFVTVNGHSKIKEKSNNTNFAVLTTIQLTQPFNDPIGYGSYIAKLSNILAGKDKVILQTYANFKSSKRTKNLYRVQPTLPENQYILGDINLAFPRRIIESIIDFIENLKSVIPGIANDDNLVYAPEVKFYSNRLCNQKIPHLYFSGDCSGHTRSIIYATAHGWQTAEELIHQYENDRSGSNKKNSRQ
ncbi:MAG: NAD(P)/FAD-dependent oxidoreductase [Candidatus Cloacimonetes bacterium]|nr:NAD(P)/FAD-dependent oxidoreductase [Candidatus Cloacimonadota bacterium]